MIARLGDFELIDHYRLVWACALENPAEYTEAANEAALELIERGIYGPVIERPPPYAVSAFGLAWPALA
jgi:hypothetical protein